MGSKRKESPVVLIAADNSGSMSAADISQVMNEVRSILKSVSEKTEVLYFDTTIAHIEKLTRLTEVKRYANGGTDFTCVMKYANEKRADVLIMLTDGDGGMKVKPKCPVIWVMPKGSQALSYPGMKVQL
jgi:predicted metal-dependent peptidase